MIDLLTYNIGLGAYYYPRELGVFIYERKCMYAQFYFGKNNIRHPSKRAVLGVF